MDRENFKSIILISLFALSIAMTGVLLKAKTPKMDLSSIDNSTDYKIDIENIFYPQGFSVSFGGGSYTGIYDEDDRELFWDEGIFILKNYLSELDLSVVDRKEWLEVERTRGVIFRLPFSITLDQLYQILNLDEISSDIKNKKISTIIMPSSSVDKIYLGNLDTEEFFRLKGKNKGETIGKYILRLEKLNFVEYRRVDDVLLFNPSEGDSGYNSEIIPVTKNKEIPVIKVSKEVNFLDGQADSELNAFLKRAFGDNMDFIKRIEGLDGSIAYVYGYNDKILRIGAEGKIEYNDRLGDYEEIKNISFGDGLKLALNNLAKYGSIPTSLYLADYYESSESGIQEKRYYFNYKIKNLNVFSKNMINGYAVEIVLKGNRVTSLNRNIKQYTKTITMSEVWPNGPLYPDAVIDKNFKTISSNYDIDFKIFDKESGENWSMNTYISDIIRNIRNIEVAYLSDDDNEENLIPTWHFSIGNTSYYFDLYSGKLLYGYKNLTEDNFLNDDGDDSEEKENSKK